MTRALRADAARNREVLLAAATAEFAARGMDASIADIARRAGVGKGTVFRHFATKDDLLAAIVLGRIEELAELASALLIAHDPGVALWDFLVVAAGKQQQLDLSVLRGASELNERLTAARDRLFPAIVALVERAQAAGVVRTDITGLDVILLMCAPVHVVTFVPDPPADLWKRYLGLIFDGMRPAGASALPAAPPTGLPSSTGLPPPTGLPSSAA